VKPKSFLKAAILVLTLLALAFAVEQLGLGSLLEEDWIDQNVRGHGAQGMMLFIAVGGVCAAIGLPRQLVAFMGGYAFGLFEGTGLALAAVTFGCALAFTYARLLGRGSVQRRFPGRVKKIDAFLADNPFSMTLLIRFLPIGSNFLTNLAAGVSSVPAFAFIAGSCLGYIPQTLIFALVGSGVEVGEGARIALAAVLFAGAGALGVYLTRKTRRARLIVPDLAEAEDGSEPKATTAPQK